MSHWDLMNLNEAGEASVPQSGLSSFEEQEKMLEEERERHRKRCSLRPYTLHAPGDLICLAMPLLHPEDSNAKESYMHCYVSVCSSLLVLIRWHSG